MPMFMAKAFVKLMMKERNKEGYTRAGESTSVFRWLTDKTTNVYKYEIVAA